MRLTFSPSATCGLVHKNRPQEKAALRQPNGAAGSKQFACRALSGLASFNGGNAMLTNHLSRTCGHIVRKLPILLLTFSCVLIILPSSDAADRRAKQSGNLVGVAA